MGVTKTSQQIGFFESRFNQKGYRQKVEEVIAKAPEKIVYPVHHQGESSSSGAVEQEKGPDGAQEIWECIKLHPNRTNHAFNVKALMNSDKRKDRINLLKAISKANLLEDPLERRAWWEHLAKNDYLFKQVILINEAPSVTELEDEETSLKNKLKNSFKNLHDDWRYASEFVDVFENRLAEFSGAFLTNLAKNNAQAAYQLVKDHPNTLKKAYLAHEGLPPESKLNIHEEIGKLYSSYAPLWYITEKNISPDAFNRNKNFFLLIDPDSNNLSQLEKDYIRILDNIEWLYFQVFKNNKTNYLYNLDSNQIQNILTFIIQIKEYKNENADINARFQGVEDKVLEMFMLWEIRKKTQSNSNRYFGLLNNIFLKKVYAYVEKAEDVDYGDDEELIRPPITETNKQEEKEDKEEKRKKEKGKEKIQEENKGKEKVQEENKGKAKEQKDTRTKESIKNPEYLRAKLIANWFFNAPIANKKVKESLFKKPMFAKTLYGNDPNIFYQLCIQMDDVNFFNQHQKDPSITGEIKIKYLSHLVEKLNSAKNDKEKLRRSRQQLMLTLQQCGETYKNCIIDYAIQHNVNTPNALIQVLGSSLVLHKTICAIKNEQDVINLWRLIQLNNHEFPTSMYKVITDDSVVWNHLLKIDPKKAIYNDDNGNPRACNNSEEVIHILKYSHPFFREKITNKNYITELVYHIFNRFWAKKEMYNTGTIIPNFVETTDSFTALNADYNKLHAKYQSNNLTQQILRDKFEQTTSSESNYDKYFSKLFPFYDKMIKESDELFESLMAHFKNFRMKIFAANQLNSVFDKMNKKANAKENAVDYRVPKYYSEEKGIFKIDWEVCEVILTLIELKKHAIEKYSPNWEKYYNNQLKISNDIINVRGINKELKDYIARLDVTECDILKNKILTECSGSNPDYASSLNNKIRANFKKLLNADQIKFPMTFLKKDDLNNESCISVLVLIMVKLELNKYPYAEVYYNKNFLETSDPNISKFKDYISNLESEQCEDFKNAIYFHCLKYMNHDQYKSEIEEKVTDRVNRILDYLKKENEARNSHNIKRTNSFSDILETSEEAKEQRNLNKPRIFRERSLSLGGASTRSKVDGFLKELEKKLIP